jgi:hypothetical protein
MFFGRPEMPKKNERKMEAAKDAGEARRREAARTQKNSRLRVCVLEESSPFMHSPRNIMKEKRSLS